MTSLRACLKAYLHRTLNLWRLLVRAARKRAVRELPRYVPPVAMPLQEQAVAALFARLGVRSVPGILIGHLGARGVVPALRLFFRDFGLDYGILTNRRHRSHERQRRQLQLVVEYLTVAEKAVEGTPLSIEPVVAGIRKRELQRSASRLPGRAGMSAWPGAGHLATVKHLLTMLERAASMWRRLSTTHLTWPSYQAFRSVTLQRLDRWHEALPEELDEIAAINDLYEQLNGRISRAASEARDLADRLCRIAGSAAHSRLAEAIARRIDPLLQDLTAGRREPAEVAEGLEELHDDLRELLRQASPRARALAVLGLSEGADPDAIRSAYRELALKHHPDRNGGDAQNDARMKEINVAYTFLIRDVQRGAAA